MRSLLLSLVLLTLSSTPSSAGPDPIAARLPALEQTWHTCVRDAYGRQPFSHTKQAAQLSALDECREHEDTYVAALMAAQVAEDEAEWRQTQVAPPSAVSWFSTITAYFTPSTEPRR
ncbi:hypothetical protein [Methylobacterium sp. 22177]|uniref:hypothetical protein n=1 Tax=Methylobacterium sp. 22177 TaxID=3453885 RepID=UPI003F853344